MSPRPLEDYDFAYVADFLLQDDAEVPSDAQLWAECEDGRARSSISRAYYSVFVALKRRIEPAWTGGAFPQRDVHKKMRRAVARQLSGSHPLVGDLKALLNERKEADYEVSYRYNIALAGPVVDRAHIAIERVEKLSPRDITGIASVLEPDA